MTTLHYFWKIALRLSVLPVLALLGGCYASVEPQNGNNALSTSQGSTLSINKKIEIKPSHTRVFIQDGIIVSQFNHYKPGCNIEVRKKDDENWQFIQPADYRVVSSQQTREEVVLFSPGQETMVASLLKTAAAGVDGGLSDIYLGIHFHLSGEDSNVMRLSCRGVLAAPHEAKPPTLKEIQQALGDIMHLKL